MRICICGGGNLAHALAGELKGEINILTRRPDEWASSINVYHNNNYSHTTKISCISSDKKILRDMDIVFITIPAFARYQYLKEIKDYINPNTIIVSAPSIGGINFIFEELFPQNPCICMQRVPYICRIKQYGQSVETDKKKMVDVYYSKNISEKIKKEFESLIDIKVTELPTFWTLMLSNSNPILHIAGICELLKGNYPYNKMPLFYDIWNNSTSELALKMDSELGLIMQKLSIDEYKNLLKHYEVKTHEELTQKLKSIPSFSKLLSPLKEVNNEFVIDDSSRYLIEDLPFGTCFIKYVASLLDIKTPATDFAVIQVQKFIGEEFIDSNGNFNVSGWEEYLGYKIANKLKYAVL